MPKKTVKKEESQPEYSKIQIALPNKIYLWLTSEAKENHRTRKAQAELLLRELYIGSGGKL